MNHLIIYAHPNPQSFNHAILSQAIQASQDHQVIVRDLYQLDFNPNLTWQELQNSFTSQYPAEIQTEHQYWQQADVITLIYPLWWMGFPAILKGYLDRVLSYGFAYQNGEIESIGLLKSKKIQQFVTLGNSNEKYAQKGFLKSLDDTLGNGIFQFCGIEDIRIHYFGDIGLKSTDYADILQKVEQNCREILR
ncbi:NAD(P)H-dependent oxidoreductase [Actinobacillus genomosp. 2]|uniref:NAD(P)H-dependent oxidoreductase n=1 Tax=Actinobacillus genomosp. 2 TaxID=230709 RepID=UPI0024432336|nr:NAD(P)H-dependent oxidoreductase [Actinobacillus genomosp. 2]WGE31865.1 NAD(P)H-dependent oxidoreductase [Actinobacillus genomosp. 2]